MMMMMMVIIMMMMMTVMNIGLSTFQLRQCYCTAWRRKWVWSGTPYL